VILNPFNQIEPIAIRQLHVRQAQVEMLGTQLTDGRVQRLCRAHIEIHSLERDLQQLANVWLVVDDEGAGSHGPRL